jgi:hypothetical protein
MIHLIIKAFLSGVLVVIVSEVARRYSGIGGLITSLHSVSVSRKQRLTGRETAKRCREHFRACWVSPMRVADRLLGRQQTDFAVLFVLLLQFALYSNQTSSKA